MLPRQLSGTVAGMMARTVVMVEAKTATRTMIRDSDVKVIVKTITATL